MTPLAPDVANTLLREAAAVSHQAHCPYSHYHVGAALLAADGSITVGCNVENASYGLTLCAERNAVVQAVAAGKREFCAIAVVADGPAMPYPCGACRQVLVEFCAAGTPVYIAVRDALADARLLALGDLLPHSFRF